MAGLLVMRKAQAAQAKAGPQRVFFFLLFVISARVEHSLQTSNLPQCVGNVQKLWASISSQAFVSREVPGEITMFCQVRFLHAKTLLKACKRAVLAGSCTMREGGSFFAPRRC